MKEWPKTFDGMWAWLTSQPPDGLNVRYEELIAQTQKFRHWGSGANFDPGDICHNAINYLLGKWLDNELTPAGTTGGEQGKRRILSYFREACWYNASDTRKHLTSVANRAQDQIHVLESLAGHREARNELANELVDVLPLARDILQKCGNAQLREVFELWWVSGLDHDMIAARLKISNELSRSRVHKCLKILKARWPKDPISSPPTGEERV